MGRTLLLSTAIVLGLLSAPAPGANLIANGSFESPAIPTQFVNYSVGSPGLPNWTIIGPAGQSVSQVRSDFAGNPPFVFPAQDGNQWIDLTGFNNNVPAGVAQTVATTAGADYSISFWVGNVSGGLFGTSSTVLVELSQGGGGSCTNSAPGLTLTWLRCAVEFTAVGSSTTISFRNGDPANDHSNGLDNISVDLVQAVVPEPATWAMLIMGFGLVGGSMRRRSSAPPPPVPSKRH